MSEGQRDRGKLPKKSSSKSFEIPDCVHGESVLLQLPQRPTPVLSKQHLVVVDNSVEPPSTPQAAQRMVSALLHACSSGDLPQIQLLLQDLPQVDLEAKGSSPTCRFAAPLLTVCLTATLFPVCATIACADDAGVTPLAHAIRNGHVEIVRVLLDAGADLQLMRW